jgi:hypothetical protein
VDRFVVGTGRCGSTLLSRMLAESPELLSLSEFMNGLDMTRRFGAAPASGPELAWLLAQPHPFVTLVLERGYEVPEIVYPFDRPGARFRRGEPIPYLLGACLPRLGGDPDALFDALLGFARARPPAPPAAHYRAVFDWLAARLRRETWVERSGSSLDYVGDLHRLFPEARFVHLHRDGREAALSMREHHAFRLAICMTTQVLSRGRPHSLAELDEITAQAAAGQDEIGRMLASHPEAEPFGRFWSAQVERGLAAARALPAGAWLALRFEDLLAEPEATLHRIAAFFELDPGRGGWIPRAAALVRGAPDARFEKLPRDEQARLAAACAPGMRLLGRT